MLILIVHGQGNYNDIVGTQTKYSLVIYNQYVLRIIYTCINRCASTCCEFITQKFIFQKQIRKQLGSLECSIFVVKGIS